MHRFGGYTFTYVSKAILAGQKRINASQHAQAVGSLEFYYANTDSKSRDGNRGPIYYMPYNVEEAEKGAGFWEVLTIQEKLSLNQYLENFAFDAKTHALIVASGFQ
jgi:hypothetical protein